MCWLTLSLLIVASYSAAQTPPRLSGVWEWNQENSPSSNGNAPERFRCKIEQQGPSLNVTIRTMAGPRRDHQTVKLTIGQDSRNEMHGGPMTSHADWDRDTLVVRSVAVIANKELHLY